MLWIPATQPNCRSMRLMPENLVVKPSSKKTPKCLSKKEHMLCTARQTSLLDLGRKPQSAASLLSLDHQLIHDTPGLSYLDLLYGVDNEHVLKVFHGTLHPVVERRCPLGVFQVQLVDGLQLFLCFLQG